MRLMAFDTRFSRTTRTSASTQRAIALGDPADACVIGGASSSSLTMAASVAGYTHVVQSAEAAVDVKTAATCRDPLITIDNADPQPTTCPRAPGIRTSSGSEGRS